MTVKYSSPFCLNVTITLNDGMPFGRYFIFSVVKYIKCSTVALVSIDNSSNRIKFDPCRQH